LELVMKDTLIVDVVRGGLAGLVATAPMTWTMRAGEQLVPNHSRGRLPPRQITERLLGEAGVKHQLDEQERRALTTLAHYGFGASAGCLLGVVASDPRAVVSRPLAGALVGTLVWAASYMGWLPAAGIRRNATEEPAGRNIQMVAAHLVWGCVAGALLDRLNVD
jgi:hypothetical protein